MANLILREINQSQLDATPVLDGQLVVCLDTGNTYRDTTDSRTHIGSDLEVVSTLPLAPLSEKIYLLKPNKLYVYLSGAWILLNSSDIALATPENASNGNVSLSLDGSEKDKSVKISGSGQTSVTTDGNGNIVINTMDPNLAMEYISTEMIDEIVGSEASFSLQDKTVTAADIGKIVTADAGYTGLSSVKISIPNNGDVSQTIDGLENMSVTIPSGYTSGGTVSLTDDVENEMKEI